MNFHAMEQSAGHECRRVRRPNEHVSHQLTLLQIESEPQPTRAWLSAAISELLRRAHVARATDDYGEEP